MQMMNKKKEQRPLITDLVDYFKEKQVPIPMKLSEVDKENYKRFKEQQVKSFNKKRMIEKNTIGINHEFSALKNRIKAGNESFRAIFLKGQVSSGSGSGGNIVIPQSAIQRPPLGSDSKQKNQGVKNNKMSRRGSLEKVDETESLPNLHESKTSKARSQHYGKMNNGKSSSMDH